MIYRRTMADDFDAQNNQRIDVQKAREELEKKAQSLFDDLRKAPPGIRRKQLQEKLEAFQKHPANLLMRCI